MIAAMRPQAPQVDAGAMVFLLEWAASDCIKAAANCKLPHIARWLQRLAAEVADERDKYHRLVMAQQPNWAAPVVMADAPIAGPVPFAGVATTPKPAQTSRHSVLMRQAMERIRAVTASHKLSTVPARLPVRR